MLNFKYLRSDLIAGITVALVLIPQSLAYAQLAGLPAQYGLYAALLPPLIASIFGSSKQLATGPVAVLSLMTAAALSQFYTPGSNDYITLAILLAFSLGIFQLILGITRLGGLVSFLSHPVVYGFTNAAAIIIATSQLSKFFNVSIGQYAHQYQTILAVLQKSSVSTDWFTLVLGIWTILLMYVLKSLDKKIPVVLITVITATLLSIFIGYKGPITGSITVGLPMIVIPKLDFIKIFELIPVVVAMGLIGFTEAISIAQAIAVKTGDKIDPNKELIGQGLANAIGAFFQSYPVTGSFSRTSVNFSAGAKTGTSSIFTALTVLLTLLFFTGLLYFIPQVVLAGVIVYSVSGLIDLSKIKYILSINKFDGYTAILTFLCTLYFAPNLEIGVGLGVVFSVGYYLYRNVHPRIVFLSKYKDGQLHDVEKFKMDRCENIGIVRLDAPLFFANSPLFENEIINDVIKHKDIRDILIVCSGMNEIDTTGEETLKTLFLNLKSSGKNLYFSEVKSPIYKVMTEAGLLQKIHKDHFFTDNKEAVKYLTESLEHKHKHTDADKCPLKKYVKATNVENIIIRDKRETIVYFYNKLTNYKKMFGNIGI